MRFLSLIVITVVVWSGVNANAVTIAKVFSSAGCDPACIGKWQVDGQGRSGSIPPERPPGVDYGKVLECTHDHNPND